MNHENNTLTIERPTDSRTHKALHGTTRQLVFNAVQGTKEGFTKELEIRGVGYQASNQGKYIVLQLDIHMIFILNHLKESPSLPIKLKLQLMALTNN